MPPAQTGIVLVLRCPGLHRTNVDVRLKVRPAKSQTGTYLVIATVTGSGSRPKGYVTFRLRGRLLGEVPIRPDGTALWSLPGYTRRSGMLRASYGGDAYHAPGSARARL